MVDTQNAQTTKQRIMNAAEDVVIRMGANHLTFDELVKQTRLSKGVSCIITRPKKSCFGQWSSG